MGSNLCGEWKGEEQSEIDVESDGGKLNINYASVDELTESDHLTRAMAARLVCHREQFGPFLRPKDLNQIPGMRKGTTKKLGKEMSFDGTCAAWTCDWLSRCQGNCAKTCKCLMKWGGTTWLPQNQHGSPRSTLLVGKTFKGEKVLTEVVFLDKIQTVPEGYNCGTATGISPLETLPENS